MRRKPVLWYRVFSFTQSRDTIAFNPVSHHPISNQYASISAISYTMLWMLLTFGIIGPTTTAKGQMLDTSSTRVQTDLAPDLPFWGTLKPTEVKEGEKLKNSPWTLGCETLDREFANYESYKEYIRPLNIKNIRLQAGWAKTEKKRGVYDFTWLDKIVDDAVARGLNIRMETTYGNPLYPGAGEARLSGKLPTSEEGLAAWDRWLIEMVKHYEGKIDEWIIWNEPDLVPAHTPEVVVNFNIRTAEVIRSIDPNAKIGALVLCKPNVEYLDASMKLLAEKKKLDLFTWIVFHSYTKNPDSATERIEQMIHIVNSHSDRLKLWQGESGIESEYCLNGALSKYPWSELTQCKWNTRRMLSDIGHDMESYVFTIADLDYHLVQAGTIPEAGNGDIDRYGLLKTDKEYHILKVKPAYYVIQNTVQIFDGSLERLHDFDASIECEKETTWFAYQKKNTDEKLVVFWDASEIPSDQNTIYPATMQFRNISFKQPVWVDLLTGNIYEVEPSMISQQDGVYTITGVPVYDGPAFITEKSFVEPIMTASPYRLLPAQQKLRENNQVNQ